MSRTIAYRVTRSVPRDAPNNTTGRDIEAGEIFYENHAPTYGCCDEVGGVVISNAGAFAEIPRDAAEVVR